MRLQRKTVILLLVGTIAWASQSILATRRVTAAADLPDENAAKPALVVRTNDYAEGVVVDHDGNLYFSREKIVTKVTPDGKSSTWAQTGSPNGHKILADGTHLICDASRHALLHLAADGSELQPAATESDGKSLRGPNDLTLDSLSPIKG